MATISELSNCLRRMKPNSAPAMRGWRVVGIVVERRGEQFTENGDVPKETPEFYLEKG